MKGARAGAHSEIPGPWYIPLRSVAMHSRGGPIRVFLPDHVDASGRVLREHHVSVKSLFDQIPLEIRKFRGDDAWDRSVEFARRKSMLIAPISIDGTLLMLRSEAWRTCMAFKSIDDAKPSNVTRGAQGLRSTRVIHARTSRATHQWQMASLLLDSPLWHISTRYADLSIVIHSQHLRWGMECMSAGETDAAFALFIHVRSSQSAAICCFELLMGVV